MVGGTTHRLMAGDTTLRLMFVRPTNEHRTESGRRHDGSSPRGSVSAGYIPDQRCRCPDTTGTQQVRVRLMVGGINTDHQCHLVCKIGHPESERADGAHQGPREEHGQVFDAVR